MTKRLANIFLYSLFILAAPLVKAFEIPEGVEVVAAPVVKKMVEQENTPLVHVLSRIEFQMQHIPGSINIPVDQLEKSSLLPVDKTAPVIFYCNGTACPYSQRASKKAVTMGYQNVHWFRGGILEWRKFRYEMNVDKDMVGIKVKKINPQQLQTMNLDDYIVLDVRPKWWRQSAEKAGIIAGTDIMIPLLELDKSLQKLPQDKPLLIVDRLMRQSVHAAKYLISKGVSVDGVLLGGTKRWVAEGYPVLSENDEPEFIK